MAVVFKNLMYEGSAPTAHKASHETGGGDEINNVDINAGTIDGVTITSPTINGTISTTGLTMPAFTLSGLVTAGGNSITGLGVLYGNSTYLRIGNAATTTHSLDSEDDLMVTGELEVYNKVFIGGTIPNPSGKLDVRGNTASGWAVSIEQDNVGGYGLLIDTDAGAANEPVFRIINTGGTIFNIGSDGTVTLGGALTLNGQVFDAGSGSAQINTTGAAKGLKIVETNDGASGVRIHGQHVSANPAIDDSVLDIIAQGKDAGGNDTWYGQIQFLIENPAEGSEASKWKFRTTLNGSFNDAMTLSGAGALWLDAGLEVGGNIIMATNAITGMADPSANQDAATKKYVDDRMPSGTIVMWHGTIADIPSGWVICDGNNGTPNLLAKFVQGVATAGTDPGATGGTTSKTTDTETATGTYGVGGINSPFTMTHDHSISDIRPLFYDVAFIMKT